MATNSMSVCKGTHGQDCAYLQFDGIELGCMLGHRWNACTCANKANAIEHCRDYYPCGTQSRLQDKFRTRLHSKIANAGWKITLRFWRLKRFIRWRCRTTRTIIKFLVKLRWVLPHNTPEQ